MIRFISYSSLSSDASTHQEKKMSVERSVEAFVGVMVLLSVALTQFLHPAFIWMTVVVGVNVIQQAITGFCPVAMVLRKVGMKTEREIGAQCC